MSITLKKIQHILSVFGFWLLLIFCLNTQAKTIQSDIIYEYKVITQEKGQAFSDFLNANELTNKQKKLISEFPILHKVKSNRQFHLLYALDKQKRFLKEIKVTRDNRMVNFVITEVGDRFQFQKEATRTQVKKNINKSIKSTSNPITKPTWEAKDFYQKKGQTFGDALKLLKLSKLQQQIIKSGDFLKEARSKRLFILFFEKQDKKLLLKGVKVTRNKNYVEYLVKKINGKYRLVNLKTLKNNERKNIQRLFGLAEVTPLADLKAPTHLVTKSLPKKKHLSVTYRSLDNFRTIGFSQKKGQSLYSLISNLDLTTIQQRLVMDMPARLFAKTDRRINLMFEKKGKNKYLKAIRVVRGSLTAEYVLIKYKGLWKWANEKGQIETNTAFSRYPLKFSRISSGFNLRRRHPITGKIRPHKGIDLKAPYGSPIYAPSNGVVVFSGRQNGYGIILEIDHQNGYHTKYAHLSRIMRNARKGSYIKKGQLTAKVGNTGISTGSHLHYEILVNGTARNPKTVRLPKSGAKKTLSTAKAVFRLYLPVLRRLSQ